MLPAAPWPFPVLTPRSREAHCRGPAGAGCDVAGLGLADAGPVNGALGLGLPDPGALAGGVPAPGCPDTGCGEEHPVTSTTNQSTAAVPTRTNTTMEVGPSAI